MTDYGLFGVLKLIAAALAMGLAGAFSAAAVVLWGCQPLGLSRQSHWLAKYFEINFIS
jgi:hypothetical protein